LVVLAAVAVAATWPASTRAVAERAGLVDVHVEYRTARVTEVEATTCSSSAENTLPNGDLPPSVPCTRVTARVGDGSSAGRVVVVSAPQPVRASDITPGMRVVLERYPAQDGAPETWAWSDFERGVPLGTLALAFVLVAAMVGGWRGLRAVVGLAFAGVVLWVYLIPALVTGRNGLVVGLASAVLIMTVVVYFAHGVSVRSSVALLGTFAGLALVAALGLLGVATAHLSGVVSEEDYQLSQIMGDGNVIALRGVFVCGVLLVGLGVLNDVTITQSAAVWELRAALPGASWRELFTGAMRIGRDHIASTIYTIAFAYAGASLPVLMLLQLYRLPVGRTLTGGAFAEEIVRTLAGSIGLVLAVPATTLLAALLVPRAVRAPERARHRVAAHTH
jgi:uncharacterized membrane protein